MRITAGENHVDMFPENQWEIDQLTRLDLPGSCSRPNWYRHRTTRRVSSPEPRCASTSRFTHE